ncbi:hypothetical protein NQD34_008644 [Periophthalmus magnuspinnatus]|nr:hypothetical protein NQD34_008644 [Periophthalmus magnuspinnatus]
MEQMLKNLSRTEFISITVRDPRVYKQDIWHMYLDYEICLETNSMCFRKKWSSVRRRYSEFVWLRQSLQQNALIIELPKLPPWLPFFHLRSPEQVALRMKGLQMFLELVVQSPLLLSDSRLHLFLQSKLSVGRMERCAQGRTRYTVADAIHRSSSACVPPLEDKSSCDSDYESCSSSSVLGLSVDTSQSEHFLEMSCGHTHCLGEGRGLRGLTLS